MVTKRNSENDPLNKKREKIAIELYEQITNRKKHMKLMQFLKILVLKLKI